ncbi:DNA methyltransferase [Mesomycoplasma molare]|uniref:DNA methyltransferase n=1 Tax=Mesomycoplasma molare TaxID=171288 RepID=A0ABY5TX70_9BACT|nr:DNA methyltransferase [Mesomycoplasma molare]UWD34591.1 DNA methyltransferase [Mesomycoplasma molare]
MDPPYNTEATKNDGNSVANDKENINSNKFIYRDKYSRNGWLNFMNERLRLAKKLLKDDGVIFVSIDDSEQAYLKVLMDEIFGEENFVANSIWFSISSVLKQSKLIRKEHEYICVYAKNISLLEFNKQENTAVFLNPDNDPNGEWLSSNAASPNQKSNKNKFQIKLPNGNYCERNWKFTFDDYINNKIPLYFKGNNVPRLKIYKKDYELFSKVQSSIFKDKGSITSAKKEIISIIEKDIFSTPKPLPLLKSIISFLTKNARILDFFAGSGTTGHAVLELNKEDGGNRTFTLVTNNENNIGIDVNYERLYRINYGVGTNNESFDWSKKNEPYKSNLNVYSMDYIDISPFSNVDTKEIIKELIKVLNDFGVNNLDQENDFDIKELLNLLLSLKPQVKE